MRAIIDADHLPTAVRYHTRILKKRAQTAANDIAISVLDPMKNVTLESLLKKLDGSSAGGEKEFHAEKPLRPCLPLRRRFPFLGLIILR